MKRFCGLAFACVLLAAAPAARAQQPEDAAEVEVTSCIQCHGTEELWQGENERLFVTPAHLEGDVHWAKGLRCHDCHGGDPASTNFITVHSAEAGFRSLKSPADVPQFCGHCHSDADYMKRFEESPSIDQVADYWTSGHGQRLKEQADAKVATCISCHGGHGMRAIDDVESPVYPTNVAKTCAECHADEKLMAGLEYDGRPLGHDQYARWSKGVHAETLLEKGNLSSATCNDCHGNHSTAIPNPAAIVDACGKCHQQPAADYWTSGHGQKLKADGDAKVATCISCHGVHGIQGKENANAPVYPTNVAKTCATCHADEKLMAGREYHGRPLGHDQYAQWKQSVHGELLLEKGDLSAATCNDCHSNHSTVVPEPAAVANACGKCHVKVADLFNQARMKHGMEEVGLPGCAACHGAHDIRHPTDEMLGMEAGAVCAKCHQDGKFGATLAGQEEARELRARLEKLKAAIADAEARVAEARRLGMEVRGPDFDLRQARQSLINARTLIHTFGPEPMNSAIEKGLETTDHVEARAQQALDEYTDRRIWLAVSLVPILVVVVVLLLYIRALPLPEQQQQQQQAAR